MVNWISIFISLCGIGSCYCINYKIAWMAPGIDTGREVNSHSSAAALKLALTSVEANPRILNGHTVEIKYFETDCSTNMTMHVAMEAKNTYSPDVFIGPPCEEGMRVAAQLCTFWNLPIFTWYNPGIEFDGTKTYPTLIRMIPSLSTMGKSLVHILSQNHWDQFVLVFDDSNPWTLYDDAIRTETAYTEFQMWGSHEVNSSMTNEEFRQLFIKIKKHSHIVVFACPNEDIRRYMIIAERAGMADGNFVFIQLDHEVHTEQTLSSNILSTHRWQRGDIDDDAARRAYQSLVHVLLDPMDDDETPTYALPRNRYHQFATMATDQINKTTTEWQVPTGGLPDVYSLYLYDTVLIWSVLVDKLRVANHSVKDGKLMAHEASVLVADGATGYISLNDENDRIGKIFIMSMDMDGSFKPTEILKFNTTNGYESVKLKPLHESVVRLFGVRTNKPLLLKNTLTSAVPKQVTEPAPIHHPAPFGLPLALPRVKIPPPPTVLPPTVLPPVEPVQQHVETTTIQQKPDGFILKLMSRLRALEKQVKEHEAHSHQHIPDHTHTPHPLLLHKTTTPMSPTTQHYININNAPPIIKQETNPGTIHVSHTNHPIEMVTGHPSHVPTPQHTHFITDHPHHWDTPETHQTHQNQQVQHLPVQHSNNVDHTNNHAHSNSNNQAISNSNYNAHSNSDNNAQSNNQVHAHGIQEPHVHSDTAQHSNNHAFSNSNNQAHEHTSNIQGSLFHSQSAHNSKLPIQHSNNHTNSNSHAHSNDHAQSNNYAVSTSNNQVYSNNNAHSNNQGHTNNQGHKNNQVHSNNQAHSNSNSHAHSNIITHSNTHAITNNHANSNSNNHAHSNNQVHLNNHAHTNNQIHSNNNAHSNNHAHSNMQVHTNDNAHSNNHAHSNNNAHSHNHANSNNIQVQSNNHAHSNNQGHAHNIQGPLFHSHATQQVPLSTLPLTTVAPFPIPITTAAPVTQAAQENGQVNDQMIDRISTRLVDHLLGTPSQQTTNTNNTQAQKETQITNDMLANHLDEIGPGLLLLRLAREQQRRQAAAAGAFYQQQLQRQGHGQGVIQQPVVQGSPGPAIGPSNTGPAPDAAWLQYNDPLARVFDPLVGVWDPFIPPPTNYPAGPW